MHGSWPELGLLAETKNTDSIKKNPIKSNQMKLRKEKKGEKEIIK